MVQLNTDHPPHPQASKSPVISGLSHLHPQRHHFSPLLLPRTKPYEPSSYLMVSFACISQKKTNNIDQVHLCSRPHWFVACVVKSCQAVLKVKHYQQRIGSGREGVPWVISGASTCHSQHCITAPTTRTFHRCNLRALLSMCRQGLSVNDYILTNQVLAAIREGRFRWRGRRTVLYKEPGPIFTRVTGWRGEGGLSIRKPTLVGTVLSLRTSLTSHSSLWSLLAGETLICIDQHAETLPISIHGLGGYSLLTDCNLRGPII